VEGRVSVARVRTAKQKAALRKAQLASARKRKGKGKARPVARSGRSRGRTALKYAAGAAVITGAGYAGYRASKRRKTASTSSKDYAARNARVVSRMKLDDAIQKAERDLNRRTLEHTEVTNTRARRRYRKAKDSLNEKQRQKKNADRQSRRNRKMADRGMYKAGLPTNISSRAIPMGSGRKRRK
jgi:hypothetical protein